jgi:type I restriction enzyme S subunit
MSELPVGWTRGTGSDAFTLVRGVTYTKADARSEPGAGLIPILRANNIQSGRIILEDFVYVPAKYVSREQFLKPGDLLIATSSGSRNVVGKTALVGPEHTGFAFGAFCSVARPKMGVVPEWMAYFIRSVEYRNYVEEVALGTNINNFRTRDLDALPLPLAPPPEQRRFLAKLDSLFNYSKSARDELDHIPRLVERYKQAIFSGAFSGELTKDMRLHQPNQVSGKQLFAELLARCAEHSTKRVEAVKVLSQPEALKDLPHGWTWCPVAVLASAVSDSVHKKPDYVEQGVPFLTVRNLTAGPGITFDGCRFITQSDHVEFVKRTNPERGDLLISKDGTLGVVRAVRTDVPFKYFRLSSIS